MQNFKRAFDLTRLPWVGGLTSGLCWCCLQEYHGVLYTPWGHQSAVRVSHNKYKWKIFLEYLYSFATPYWPNCHICTILVIHVIRPGCKITWNSLTIVGKVFIIRGGIHWLGFLDFPLHLLIVHCINIAVLQAHLRKHLICISIIHTSLGWAVQSSDQARLMLALYPLKILWNNTVNFISALVCVCVCFQQYVT